MKILPDDTRIKVIRESREWAIAPEIADFFEGIYQATTAGIHFDVKFVPQFKRSSNKWFLNTPDFFEDVTSKQEARLMTASDYTHTVAPSINRAGTKETFLVPPLPENDPVIHGLDNKTVYYVTPKNFYTFRGELATVAEKTIGIHRYVEFDEVSQLSFIKFILNNIMTSDQLEKIKEMVRV